MVFDDYLHPTKSGWNATSRSGLVYLADKGRLDKDESRLVKMATTFINNLQL